MSDGCILPKRITLADIARQLSVSTATVSLALRNDPQISKPRRDQIARLAAKLGYRPDPMLSALNRYRHRAGSAAPPASAALGWINRWRRPAALREFHEFDEYWHGAQEMAEARGYHLEEFIWHEKLSGERLKNILLTRGIHGVLIPPAERSKESDAGLSWDDFPWKHFASVRLGRSIAAAPCFPVVASDQVYNCRLAFEEIRRRGHTRIGFVTSKRMVAFTLTMAGFLMAQAELPTSSHLRPLLMDSTGGNRTPKAFRQWLRQTRPQAILSDAPPVRGWLNDLGFRVPEDLTLVTLSILDGDATSGIHQHSREIGRTAVEVLISLIDRHVEGIPEIGREMLVQGHWVENRALPGPLGERYEFGGVTAR